MTHGTDLCIVLASSLPRQKERAETLSEKLALPLLHETENRCKYRLVLTDTRLELHLNPHLVKSKVLPVFVDFLPDHRLHPRLAGTTIRAPLARAVGVKPGFRPTIVDATAGLGMDGLCLAWLGCQVSLIERSPLIHSLLEDGLQRAQSHPKLGETVRNNITLLAGDSNELLQNITCPPHSVLLDPMYPLHKKGARNKKEMRILRDLVGDDGDVEQLFRTACRTAENRVVVKRPSYAAPLRVSPAPSHQIGMKSGRFDVYLKTHL